MAKRFRRRVKIYLLDPHPVVRQGLLRLIEREPGLAVCGQGGHSARALRDISTFKPEFVIMSLTLDGMHGLQLIKQIKARRPDIKILVLTACDGSLYAERCLRAGATGFVGKKDSLSRLRSAVNHVLNGHRVGLQSNTKMRKGALFALNLLSDRELEVFKLIGKGYRTTQIAKHLGLSHKTIESFREKIKLKLNLSHGYEMIRHAIQFSQLETSHI